MADKDGVDITVTVEEIKCLTDGVRLDSEVILFWLECWCEQVGAGSADRELNLTSNPRCWFANIYFFSRLMEDGVYSYQAVRNREVD